jgi:hypothetical protein
MPCTLMTARASGLWSVVLLGMRLLAIASSVAYGISRLLMSRIVPLVSGQKVLAGGKLGLWYAHCRERRPIRLSCRQTSDPPGTRRYPD